MLDEKINYSRDGEDYNQLKFENKLLNSGYFQLKKTTDKLRESEEKFLKAFDSSPYAIVITRLSDNQIINVNETFTMMSGYNREEALLKSALELDLWANNKDRDSVIASLKKGKEINDYEFNFKRKNGEIITGLFSAKLINLAKEPCIISSISDITERKKLEEMILNKQTMLETAESVASLGSYSLDVKANIWTSSKVLDKIFGITSNFDHTTESWNELIVPEQRKEIADYFVTEVLGKKHNFDKKYQIIRYNDKEIRWVHGLGKLEFNEKKEVIKMVGTVQDITEQKKAELSLAQKNRALEMVRGSNQALIHATNEKRLLSKICDIIVSVGGYRLAWIGYLKDDKNKTIEPVAQAGHGADYVKTVNLTWADAERGRGPGGRSARTGKPVVVKNILTDNSMLPWREEAIKNNYKSTVFLPLINNNVVFGVLGIYSSELDVFNKDELAIFNEFASDLSFGITALKTKEENKKIQKALITSEAKYRSLFEAAKDGIIILDAKTGEISEVNYYLIELLGYSPNYFIRHKFWEIDIFKVISNSQKSFNELTKQKFTHLENIPIQTKSGKAIFIDFISNLYSINKSGTIQCNIRNVTDRYNLEEQISQSEKRYSTLVENINDAVILIQDSVIKYVNPSIKNILNLTPQEIIGKPLSSFIPPAYHELVAKNLEEEARNKIIKKRFEFALLDKTGKIIPVETNNSKIVYEGRPAKIAILRDISRAKQLDNIKSEFISVASHQLRGPLTGIKWFSHLLINQKIGRLTDKQTNFIQQIYDSNERMIRLVNDLLDVSHIETGQKFSIIKKPADIVSLINKVIKDQKIFWPAKKISIKLTNNCPKNYIFNYDEDKIYQVFANLISNSIKYSLKNPKILIDIECHAKVMKFQVKDFGYGIPDNQKDRIFEKFFRADNIATISTDGTGLGLYITRGIVEAHGGKIWFESVQNVSTTFFFTLPLNSNNNKLK